MIFIYKHCFLQGGVHLTFKPIYCQLVKYIRYTKVQNRKNPSIVKIKCCRSMFLSCLLMFLFLLITKYIFQKSFILSTFFVVTTCSLCKISYTSFRKASINAMHILLKIKTIIIKKVVFISHF